LAGGCEIVPCLEIIKEKNTIAYNTRKGKRKKYKYTKRAFRLNYCKTHNKFCCRCGWEFSWHGGEYNGESRPITGRIIWSDFKRYSKTLKDETALL